MTDKEKIEIDGVDITSCCHRENNLCSCPHYKKECAKNPNCHFKIVERQRKKIDKFYRKELELCQQLARKTQECEELKKNLKSLKRQYKLSCLDCEYKNMKADVNRYRKALEKIEEIVKINCEEICGRKFEDCNDFLCPSKNIIDIINKAKGEGNG